MSNIATQLRTSEYPILIRLSCYVHKIVYVLTLLPKLVALIMLQNWEKIMRIIQNCNFFHSGVSDALELAQFLLSHFDKKIGKLVNDLCKLSI